MAIAWDTSVAASIATAIRTVGKQLTYRQLKTTDASSVAGFNAPTLALTEYKEPRLIWGILTDFRDAVRADDATKETMCKAYIEPELTVQVGDIVADGRISFAVQTVRSERPAEKVLVYVAELVML